MLLCFLIKWVLQLKKIEQNCPDDVNKKINPACTAREETVESEDEESNTDDISKNIASNMSIVDGEKITNSDGKPKESGAQLDLQSSLPEVIILDEQSYDYFHFLPSYLLMRFFLQIF